MNRRGAEADLILHVGAPKCGSSSIQTALSARPEFTNADGRKFSYVAIRNDGRLISGEPLRQRAASDVFRYVTAPDVAPREALPQWMHKAPRHLATLASSGVTPIVSSEGWIRRAPRFAEGNFFTAAGLSAHVIIFIRPPVDWVNSAWWQWGVWGKAPVKRFARANIEAVRWNRLIQDWRLVPGVSGVSVRLATEDAVSGFFDVLGADAPQREATNTGLPPSLLQFFLRNRAFRDGPHQPQFEFVAARALTGPSFAPPWALAPDIVEELQVKLLRSNQNVLRSKIRKLDRPAMENDPRWWDPVAYLDRQASSQEDLESREALSDLAASLARGAGRTESDVASEIAGWPALDHLPAADATIARLLTAARAHDAARPGETAGSR